MEQVVLDLLVAAGYFRARMQALSLFDRILGGLVWSIDIAAEHIDVAFYAVFQEDAPLGHKIKLCDDVVQGLVALGMPHQIQAHQIHGLDLQAIIPVIQWIIQLAIKQRTASANNNRKLAIKYAHINNVQMIDKYTTLGRKYTLKRMYKITPGTEFQDIQAQVESTLLEYGAEKAISKYQMASNKARKGSKRSEKAEKEENSRKERLAALKGKLVQNSAGSNIDAGKIHQADAQMIQSLDNEFANTAFNSEQDLEKQALLAHNRRKENMSQYLESITSKLNGLEVTRGTLMEEYSNLRAILDKLIDRNESFRKQISEMASVINADQQSKNSKLQKLQQLIEINSNLKEREKKFKADCREKHEALLKQISDLEISQDEDYLMKEIESSFLEESKKLQEIREALAEKNLVIAQLSRSIDEVPSRAELLQYEKRFMELYDLVASKLQENKKVVEQYNVLEQTLSFLQKQISLLNSIQEAFPKATKTAEGRENFQKSVMNILDGVKKSKSKISKDLITEKKEFEILNNKYSELLDVERQYFKLLKDFQEECVNNERYLNILKERGFNQ